MYFGYDPRRCFGASHSATRLNAKISWFKDEIRGIAYGTSDILRELQSLRLGTSPIAYTIFQIFPSDEQRHFIECHVECVSRWALDILLRACEIREHDAVAKLDRYLSRNKAWAASFRGSLLEWKRQVSST